MKSVKINVLGHVDLAMFDLQSWNRHINESVPLKNYALPWPREGADGYDCKGFVAIKIRLLIRKGFDSNRMRILIVDEGRNVPSHMVLQVDSEVLDNMSAWIQKPSDYNVLYSTPITFLPTLPHSAEALVDKLATY